MPPVSLPVLNDTILSEFLSKLEVAQGENEHITPATEEACRKVYHEFMIRVQYKHTTAQPIEPRLMRRFVNPAAQYLGLTWTGVRPPVKAVLEPLFRWATSGESEDDEETGQSLNQADDQGLPTENQELAAAVAALGARLAAHPGTVDPPAPHATVASIREQRTAGPRSQQPFPAAASVGLGTATGAPSGLTASMFTYGSGATAGVRATLGSRHSLLESAPELHDCQAAYFLRQVMRSYPSVVAWVQAQQWTGARNRLEAEIFGVMADALGSEAGGFVNILDNMSLEIAVRRLQALRLLDENINGQGANLANSWMSPVMATVSLPLPPAALRNLVKTQALISKPNKGEK